MKSYVPQLKMYTGRKLQLIVLLSALAILIMRLQHLAERLKTPVTSSF
jgi:hypothetical protein